MASLFAVIQISFVTNHLNLVYYNYYFIVINCLRHFYFHKYNCYLKLYLTRICKYTNIFLFCINCLIIVSYF